MRLTFYQSAVSRQRLLPDVATQPLKAHVRKTDARWMQGIGHAIRTVRGARSLKEFAAVIDRDERQVARWEEAVERPHLDAIFAVEELRAPMVVGLARLADGDVEIDTVIRVRRAGR